MKINLRKIYIFSISTVFFILGYMLSFNMLDEFPKIVENKILIILLYFLLLFFAGYKKNRISKSFFKFLLIWQVLIIFIIISIIINNNYNNVLNYIFLLILPLVINVTYLKENISMILLPALLTLVPLIIRNIGEINNELGMNIAVIGILTTNMLLYKKKNKNFYLLINFIIFSILIFFTSSRTSFLAFLVIVLINIIIIIKNENKSKLLIIAPLIVMGLLLYNLKVQNVFYKIYYLFMSKWDHTNSIYLLSGRELIWSTVLESGISIFGNGPNYFLINTGYADAHNSFIQALGEFGLIVFILYVSIFILIYIRIIKIKNKLPYINFFTAFVIISLFEDLFFASTRFYTITILFFVYIFMLFNEELKREKGFSLINNYEKDLGIK